MEINKKLYGDAILHVNKDDNTRKFTLAIIYNEDAKNYRLGYSTLNPCDKNYCKRTGRVRALGIAKSKMALVVSSEAVTKASSTTRMLIDIYEEASANISKDAKDKGSLRELMDAICKSVTYKIVNLWA